MRYKPDTLPRMPIAELRLWNDEKCAPEHNFSLLCTFCRGEFGENGCISFGITLDDPDDATVAIQMLMDHYTTWHPSILKVEE